MQGAGNVDWFFGAVAGFAFGLLSAYLTLRVQRSWQSQDQAAYAAKIVASLVSEIEEGISRTRYLAGLHERGEVSFSRIYTALWESTNQSLAASLRDADLLKLLHQIYYRFDLINFNFAGNRPGPAGAFAAEYLGQLEEDLARLREMTAE